MSRPKGLQLVPYGISRSFGPDDPAAGTEHPVMLEYTYARPGDERMHYGRPIEWRPNDPFEAGARAGRDGAGSERRPVPLAT